MTGSLHSFAMTPSLGTLRVQEDGDGVTPHKCSVFASRGCRRRAELMALLCRVGVIFWEEGGPRERGRPRKRPRKLPLLNSRPCSERGSRETGPGRADLPQSFPQPLAMSVLREASAEGSLLSVGSLGLGEIIPMGPDLGSEVPCSAEPPLAPGSLDAVGIGGSSAWMGSLSPQVLAALTPIPSVALVVP